MSNRSKWFDDNWMRQRDIAIRKGLQSLAQKDQTLVVVGFLFDSCIGDGEWAIVDGVIDGGDEGLTVHMPAALDEIGSPKAAEHIRELIRLRELGDDEEEDDDDDADHPSTATSSGPVAPPKRVEPPKRPGEPPSQFGDESSAEPNRDLAVQHWNKVEELFGECLPDGDRVMLAQLYEWYHAQPIA